MTAPIYVPSYHRADPARTPTLACLERAGLSYSLVVEPDQEQEYRIAFPHDRYPGLSLVTTPTNGRGMVGVRRDMLAMARMTGQLWYWQIDDDVLGFSSFTPENAVRPIVQHESIPRSPLDIRSALERIEGAVADFPRVAVASPMTVTQADLTDPAFFAQAQQTRNGETVLVNRAGIYSFMLTRTDTGQVYDPAFTLRSGVDFALAHLTAGWEIMVCLSVRAFYAPTPRQSRLERLPAGGLAEVYAKEGAKERAIVQLHAKWPNVTEARLGGIYPPFLIHWDLFPPRPRP